MRKACRRRPARLGTWRCPACQGPAYPARRIARCGPAKLRPGGPLRRHTSTPASVEPFVTFLRAGAEVPVRKREISRVAHEIPADHVAGVHEMDLQVGHGVAFTHVE